MTYLPLKINSASVIPVIFANAIMMAPIQIASFFPSNSFIQGMNYFLGMPERMEPVHLRRTDHLIYILLHKAADRS